MNSKMLMLMLAGPAFVGCGQSVAPSVIAAEGLARDDVEDDEGVDHDDADEVAVPIGDLPAAVLDALDARFPGATLLSAELEGDVYDVDLLDADGVCLEAEVTPDGTLMEVETEDAVECD